MTNKAILDLVRTFPADDFELINPGVGVLSKGKYFRGGASFAIDYRVFEPDEAVAVHLHDEVAAIRYRPWLEIVHGGDQIPLYRYWHADSYEGRGGRWQFVGCRRLATRNLSRWCGIQTALRSPSTNLAGPH